MFAFIGLASCYLVRPHEEKSFLSWMRETGQVFTGEEYHLRFGIFVANSRRVQEFNKAGHSFRVSMNKFACLTPAEYQARLTHRTTAPYLRTFNAPKARGAAPDAFDYRTLGYVNRIQDQDPCGASYAFSVCQSAETVYAIATNGTLLKLSEQNLIDCVTANYGCFGGDEEPAVQYVIASQGGYFNLQSDYPYTGEQDDCTFVASKGVAKISGYFRPTSATTADENALKEAIYASGAASAAIDASSFWFQAYTSGVYDQADCSSVYLTHAVGIVGYGSDSGNDYWIVRNSWGGDWGIKGYAWMSRNKNNQCGIATDTIIVKV
jgi:cathepsin L